MTTPHRDREVQRRAREFQGRGVPLSVGAAARGFTHEAAPCASSDRTALAAVKAAIETTGESE